MKRNITQKVSFGEKVGYSLGDAAANVVFQMIVMFQLKFYTDVFGLEGTVAGTIMMIASFSSVSFSMLMVLSPFFISLRCRSFVRDLYRRILHGRLFVFAVSLYEEKGFRDALVEKNQDSAGTSSRCLATSSAKKPFWAISSS